MSLIKTNLLKDLREVSKSHTSLKTQPVFGSSGFWLKYGVAVCSYNFSDSKMRVTDRRVTLQPADLVSLVKFQAMRSPER